MLPSVDSLLACRVILLLISTARPVSVLLWMVLRSFLPPASAGTDTRTKKEEEEEKERRIESITAVDLCKKRKKTQHDAR